MECQSKLSSPKSHHILKPWTCNWINLVTSAPNGLISSAVASWKWVSDAYCGVGLLISEKSLRDFPYTSHDRLIRWAYLQITLEVIIMKFYCIFYISFCLKPVKPTVPPYKYSVIIADDLRFLFIMCDYARKIFDYSVIMSIKCNNPVV